MHSISCHKYPPPPYTTQTLNSLSSPSKIITMKHYYTTTHKYNLLMMKTKFPPPINSWDQDQQQTPNSPNFVQEPFGGFVWPPRFYTCTFCRREFRSAQALGGHMNVHRRDRARLKQSSPPQTRDVNEGFIETKLSMGIELFDGANNVICKRHKKSSPLPFLHNASPSYVEDIDLELRLGDPPAVKLET